MSIIESQESLPGYLHLECCYRSQSSFQLNYCCCYQTISTWEDAAKAINQSTIRLLHYPFMNLMLLKRFLATDLSCYYELPGSDLEPTSSTKIEHLQGICYYSRYAWNPKLEEQVSIQQAWLSKLYLWTYSYVLLLRLL